MTKAIKKISGQPTVIGVNKHYEELTIRDMKITHLETQLKLEIEVRDQWRVNYYETLKHLEELQVEFKAKMDKITQLHDDLGKAKTIAECFRLSNIGFENENIHLKARKWYELIFK